MKSSCEFANLISCSGRLEHLSPEMSLKNKTKITFHLRTLLKEINNAGLHVGSPWSMKRNHITTFSNLRPMIIADLILGPTWSLKRNQILTSGNLPQKPTVSSAIQPDPKISFLVSFLFCSGSQNAIWRKTF